MTNMMNAMVHEEVEKPLVFHRLPRPSANSGQVLVRVKAAGLNPLDTKIWMGKAPHAKQPLGSILGMDFAGIIEGIGPDVSGFAVGDRVFGLAGGVGGNQGSLAEYAALDARLLAHIPDSLSFHEAAALPLVFITAWEGLVDRSRITSGDRVLVQGGAGGVGHVAIQIAKAKGAEVYATGSMSDMDYIFSLGATPIDYNTETVQEYLYRLTDGEGFDLVYDTVGGAVLDASFEAVGKFGRVVTSLGWGTHSLAPLSFKGGTYSGVFTLLPLITGKGRAHHGEIMRAAAKLAASGKLIPRLDPTQLDFSNVMDGYHRIIDAKHTGRLVVDID